MSGTKSSVNTAAPIPSGDLPSDPILLDLREKLARLLDALGALQQGVGGTVVPFPPRPTKQDTHVLSISSDDICF